MRFVAYQVTSNVFRRRSGLKDLGSSLARKIPTKSKFCLDLRVFVVLDFFSCVTVSISQHSAVTFTDETTDRLYLLEFVLLSRSDLASIFDSPFL